MPTAAPALEDSYRQLRRCRLPYVAAASIGLWAGADPEDLLELCLTDRA